MGERLKKRQEKKQKQELKKCKWKKKQIRARDYGKNEW